MLKLAAQTFTGQVKDPGEVIRKIKERKLAGALTLHFNQGGVCQQVEWKEKAQEPIDWPAAPQ